MSKEIELKNTTFICPYQ